MTVHAAAKAALDRLLADRKAADGTSGPFFDAHIDYGFPGELGGRTNVWLGDTTLGDDSQPGFGGPVNAETGRRRRRIRETFVLHVWVEVFEPTSKANSGRVTEARAAELAEAVRDEVRDNPRLEVDGVPTLRDTARPDGLEMRTDRPGDNVRTLIDVRIRITDESQ